jgi:hypothetical protein
LRYREMKHEGNENTLFDVNLYSNCKSCHVLSCRVTMSLRYVISAYISFCHVILYRHVLLFYVVLCFAM